MENKRVAGIDIFRGLTLALMIFVNDLPGMNNIPDWLKHMPREVDGLGLADIVFPLFIFVMGMSIPLSIEHRRKKGESNKKIMFHVLIRALALLIIGMFRVNIPSLNAELTGIPKNLWAMIAYFFIFLVWNIYPAVKNKIANKLFIVIRIAGGIGLLWLAIIYRGGTTDSIEFFQPRWWGILGLIGWSYLIGSIIYINIGNSIKKTIIALAVFCAYHLLAELLLDFLHILPGSGSMTALAIAGMLVISMMKGYQDKIKTFYIYTALTGLLFFALCFITRPIWGISKLNNTPSWIYLSLAIGFWVFILIHWLVDVKGIKKWAFLIEPAGAGALTAYVLSDFYYYFIWFWGIQYPEVINSGLLGILKSIIFVTCMLALVNVLKKIHIGLRI